MIKTGIISILLLVGLISTGGAQHTETVISGLVIDKKHRLPLPGVHVFISGTSIGASTDKNGAFTFKTSNLPPKTYKLVFTIIGYQSTEIEITLPLAGSSSYFEVELKEKIFHLDSITVQAKVPKQWQKNLSRFENALLGETRNGRNARLMNPEVLEFTYEDGILQASSLHELLLSNQRLGYDVYFKIESFKWITYQDLGSYYFSYIRFKEKKPLSEHQKNEWIENRRNTFLSSVRYFFNLLNSGEYPQEYGFDIIEGNIQAIAKDETFSHNTLYAWGIHSIEPGIYRNMYLYKLRQSELIIDSQNAPERGIKTKDGQPVLVDQYGNIINLEGVLLSGLWAQQRTADMLPLDYEYK